MNSKLTTEPTEAPETLSVTEASAPETTPTPKPAKARKPKSDMTLADLCERYIKHLEDDGKSPGTVSSYRAELRLVLKALGAETPIASIKTEQVAAFFQSRPVVKLRSGKPKSPLSVAKTLRVSAQAFQFAVAKKWLASAPLPAPAAEQA
jgi:site-specific recombinase XerD